MESEVRHYVALDLSSTSTGYAVFKLNLNSKQYEFIEKGIFKPKGNQVMVQRLLFMYDSITDLLNKYPNCILLKEKAQVMRFASGILGVARVHGVVELIVAQLDIYPHEDVHIKTIKAWANKRLGYVRHKPDKKTVARAVRKELKQPSMKFNSGNDDSDACGVFLAWYYKNHGKMPVKKEDKS